MREFYKIFLAFIFICCGGVSVAHAADSDEFVVAGKLYVDSAMATLKPVAFSGSHNDLADIPADADTQADWAQTDSASPAFIQNKPALANVATSGSYNDLSDRPTLPEATLYEVRSNSIRGNNNTPATGTNLDVSMGGLIFRLTKIASQYQYTMNVVNETGATVSISAKYDQYYGGGAVEVASRMQALNDGASMQIDNNVGYGTSGSDVLLSYVFDATNLHAYRVTAMFYIGNVALIVEKLH